MQPGLKQQLCQLLRPKLSVELQHGVCPASLHHAIIQVIPLKQHQFQELQQDGVRRRRFLQHDSMNDVTASGEEHSTHSWELVKKSLDNICYLMSGE